MGIFEQLVAGACASALWLSVAAAATPSRTGTGARPPSRVSFIDAPSAEKPAARKKRLQKECRGRPDAGACRGLTGRQ